ncbi:MAG: hypothetical protein KME30_27070 [Iphinoe sp. HA4291-MV1]|nr:hypothetical protein [Iphinoe sp. HA4291-MV1]
MLGNPEVKKASIELGQPVILSSITDSGEWALGIIPDITKEDEEYSAQYSGDSSPSTVERNSRLSEKGQAFLDYLKRTDKQSISLRDACRSFSFKGNKQSVDEMRGILQELHSCELGELQSDTFTLF